MLPHTQEGASYLVAISKTGELRNHIEAMIVVLHEGARAFQMQAFDGLRGRLAGLRLGGAAKLSRRQARDIGQVFHTETLGKVWSCMGQRSLDPVRFRLKAEQGRKLRLPASQAVIQQALLQSWRPDAGIRV